MFLALPFGVGPGHRQVPSDGRSVRHILITCGGTLAHSEYRLLFFFWYVSPKQHFLLWPFCCLLPFSMKLPALHLWFSLPPPYFPDPKLDPALCLRAVPLFLIGSDNSGKGSGFRCKGMGGAGCHSRGNLSP